MKLTFKQFLSEKVIKGWDISGTDDHKSAYDLLIKNCSAALAAAKRGTVIYRGFGSGLPYNINLIDFTHGERSSRDSNNAYQIMMNASDGFKDYPSRSKSFICSTSNSMAREYSKGRGAFVMLPFNGTKIGVLETNDIFDTIINNKYFVVELLSLDSYLTSVLKYGLDFNVSLKDLSEPSIIDSALSEIDPASVIIAIQKFFSNKLKHPLFDANSIYDPLAADELADTFALCTEKPHLIEYLNSGKALTVLGKELLVALKADQSKMFSALSSIFLTPKTMHAELVMAGDNIGNSDAECWFSGKAYVVAESLFNDILDEISGKL